jgi:hypothetical protein
MSTTAKRMSATMEDASMERGVTVVNAMRGGQVTTALSTSMSVCPHPANMELYALMVLMVTLVNVLVDILVSI